VHTPQGDIEVMNVHVPAATSSGVGVKVATFEGIACYLTLCTSVARIMCGDFNTPKSEAMGRMAFWGSPSQQRAERELMESRAHGLRDAFRWVHGTAVHAGSWRASKTVTRRYDHVFASAHLEPVEAEYGDLERIVTDGLSDHAPLRVTFHRSDGTAERPTAAHHPVPAPVNAQRTSAHTSEVSMKNHVDDTELREFLSGLNYRKDIREDPDDPMRRQFREGWKKAMSGGSILEATLRDRLTWNNLGFRAGRAFGAASDARILSMFDKFATMYVRDRRA
jgi:hypothetical protein